MKSEIKHEGYYQKYFIIFMGLLSILWIYMLFLGDWSQYYTIWQGRDFLGDFVYGWTAYRDPYNWETGSTEMAGNICYPPLGFLILFPFSKLTSQNVVVIMMLLLYVFFFLLGALLIFDNIKTENTLYRYLITLLFFTSLVYIWSFERGNIIIISAIFSLLFLFGFDSKNSVIKEISLIALAISAGIKLYPAIFGIVLIKRKRYNEAFRAIIYGLLAFFLPFLFFRGGLNCIPLFFRNLKLFEEAFKYLDHPVFNFKYFANRISDEVFRDNVYLFFKVIDKVLILFAVISSFLSKSKWKEILILSISIIWFSVHSGLYMGMFFFSGIVFFLNEANESRFHSLCFILIVLLLNPLQIILPSGESLSLALTNIATSSLACILILNIIIEWKNDRKKMQMKQNKCQ